MCHCNPNIRTVRCRNCPEVVTNSDHKVNNSKEKDSDKLKRILHQVESTLDYNLDYLDEYPVRAARDRFKRALYLIQDIIKDENYNVR